MARPADPHRREEILRAAIEMFIEQGYSETRLADIAKRAGVVVSTLYLYFDSKEEMVRAIAQRISSQLLDQLLPVIEHLEEPADIEHMVEIIASFAANYRDEIVILHLESGLSGVRLRNIKHRRGPRVQQAISAIERQATEGSLYPYDPSLVVEMLFAFLRWFVAVYAALEEEETAALKAFGVQWLCHALLRST